MIIYTITFVLLSITSILIKSEQKKRETSKSWPLIKNPQFLSNPYETWWKWLPHEAIIFTKFHEDGTKIVDFLLLANFWKCPVFFPQTLQLWIPRHRTLKNGKQLKETVLCFIRWKIVFKTKYIYADLLSFLVLVANIQIHTAK